MIVDSPKPIAGASLKAAGVTGILRYLAKQGGSSVVVGVTAAEISDLRTHGIQLALIYEAQSASWMGGGAAAGTRAAYWVQSQLDAIGVPNAPVYFAADSTTLSANAVNACLDAIAAVLGRARTGEYGFAPQLRSGHAGDHAARYWLCGSSSGIQSWMNLYQQNNTAPVVGRQSVDADTAVQGDWGQIGLVDDMNLSDNIVIPNGPNAGKVLADINDTMYFIDLYAGQAASVVQDPTVGNAALAAKLGSIAVQLTQLSGQIKQEEADLLAALKANAAQVDPAALASALESGGFPQSLVSALLAVLSKAGAK